MLERRLTSADQMADNLEPVEKYAVKLLDTAREYDGLPGFHGVVTALQGLAQECRLHVQGMNDQLNVLRAAVREQHECEAVRH